MRNVAKLIGELELMQTLFGTRELAPHFDAIRRAMVERDELQVLRSTTGKVYISMRREEAR